MIEEKYKYFCLSGSVFVGGPSTWHVTDWDQRRVVSVTMDGEQDEDAIAIKHFSRHSSKLPPNVHRIHISDDGEVISVYTDLEDDQNPCIHYPLLSDISIPEGILTVRRDELEELDRLGPLVDLVRYTPSPGASPIKVVFKYHFVWQRAPMAWKEMNLWMRLPPHPNIVAFDRLILDELDGRVVGFTSVYVPGDTLEGNKSRVFKLKWLKQLIAVVDLLNLQHGIVHQDIAPRNLLIDDSTDSIKLFDFNFSARVSWPLRRDSERRGEGENYVEARNDVMGVALTIYELITQDYSLRDVARDQLNPKSLSKKWKRHPKVKLDHSVASYRLVLRKWEKRRAGIDLQEVYRSGAMEAIDWPSRPRPSPFKKTAMGTKSPVCKDVIREQESRQEVQARGGNVLKWERLPQRFLEDGVRMLSSGEVLETEA
ncbi:hypothetical protein F4808DRAFT_475405 [Astrocystis sublimbata]|nr:hypothetical protein F4808DRAFT_475405 [Astrocystis sublimbata]